MQQIIQDKMETLKKILLDMGNALVAYSGGVDSTFLMRVAKDVLDNKVLAVTASSETYPSRELAEAIDYGKQMGIRHLVIHTSELNIAGFADNPPDRCYFCKHELFSKLGEIAKIHNIQYILDGSNYDDRNDHRPGMRAARELGVRSPLKEAGLTKADIRVLSKAYDLPTWDKPSFACLSSRFPYGTKITPKKLVVIDEAEEFIRGLGFNELRVRHHDSIARVEIGKKDFIKFFEHGDVIAEKLKKLGFLYVTLDVEGYRTGSMNLSLESHQICNNLE